MRRRDLAKMHSLHIHMLIWLPPAVFWCRIYYLKDNSEEEYATCEWEIPGQLQYTASHCSLKDSLEKPNFLLYLALILGIIYGVFLYRKDLARLKRLTFDIHFLITIAIRCLSSFSGFTIWPSYYSLPFNSNSPAKGLWLWFLVECGI